MVKVRLLRYTPDGVKLVAEGCRVSGIPEGLSDEEIVRMVVENDYTSAIEHIYFTFDISEISVALSRELLEHRIASHTARSTRYNVEKDFGYVIPPPIRDDDELVEIFKEAMESARQYYTKIYERMLEKGYSKSDALEVARYVLPMATHTHYIWTINARSLINFLGLRLCKRAAPEMRELAQKIYDIVVEIYPEIFKDIGCRGYNLGLCPENEARPKDCPFRAKIPTKKEVKESWKKKD
jgi:thymidylate synthase (FAD)